MASCGEATNVHFITGNTNKRKEKSSKNAALCVSFSRHDPSLMAVSGEFNEIWLPRIDGPADAEQPTSRLSYGAWVAETAFSPNGLLLAAAGYRNQVVIWELKTRSRVQTLRHGGPVLSLSFGVTGSRIASGGRDGILRIHQVKTGLCVRETHMHAGELRSIAFSPRGECIAMGCAKPDESNRLPSPGGRLTSPGGPLSSGGSQRNLAIQYINANYHPKTLFTEDTQKIKSIAFSPGAELLAIAHGKHIELIDVKLGKKLHDAYKLPDDATAVAFAPRGLSRTRLLLVGSKTKGDTGCVRSYITNDGYMGFMQEIETDLPVHSLSMPKTHDSKATYTFAAVGCGVEESHDAPDGNAELKLLHVDQAGGMSIDLTVQMGGLDSLSGSPPREGADKTLVINVCVNASGSMIAIARDTRVELFYMLESSASTTGSSFVMRAEHSVLQAQEGMASAIEAAIGSAGQSLQRTITRGSHAFLEVIPGGTVDADVEEEPSIRATPSEHMSVARAITPMPENVEGTKFGLQHRGTLVHRNLIQAIAFSPDGNMIATGGCENVVKLFSVSTKEEIWQAHYDNWVRDVSFSPDSTALAVGGRDNIVEVCDLNTGEAMFTEEHAGWVVGLQFADLGNRDERRGYRNMALASASKDGTVRLWPYLGNGVAKRTVAFWARSPMPKTPPINLPLRTLLMETSPSGRTLIAHAAAQGNVQWLQSLFAWIEQDDTDVKFLQGSLMKRDVNGRNALDHALHLRNRQVLEILLRVSRNIPTRSREELFMHSNDDGVPLFLPSLATFFPELMLDLMQQTGFCKYEDYENAPKLDRAPRSLLTMEEGLIRGWPSSCPPEHGSSPAGIWDDVHTAAGELLQTGGASDFVNCRIVGVPKLTERPPGSKSCFSWAQSVDPRVVRTSDVDLFEILVSASRQQCPKVISTDAMQAVITYKWHTFGFSRWRFNLVLFIVYTLSSIFGLLIATHTEVLTESASGVFHGTATGWDEWMTGGDALILGTVFLSISFAISVLYAGKEFMQFRMVGARAYLSSFYNLCDMASISTNFIVCLLVFSDVQPDQIDRSARFANENLLRVLAASSVLLLFFRFMAVMRGSKGVSALLLLVIQTVIDIGPFLVVLATFLVLCGVALLMLTDARSSLEYSTWQAWIFSTYKVPLVGDLADRSEYEHNFSSTVVVIYMYFFANIVMLNILIAIMGKTFGDVQERMKEQQLLQRAELLIEEQDMMIMFANVWDSVLRAACVPLSRIKARQMRRDVKCFPNWLHVLAPSDRQTAAAQDRARDKLKVLENQRRMMVLMDDILEGQKRDALRDAVRISVFGGGKK